MIDREVFAARLKELRTLRQLSAYSIAFRLNITKQSVHTWETKKTLPSADKLVELADLLDCSIDYLVGRSEDPKRR